MAITVGTMRSCIQSQSVFVGWYCRTFGPVDALKPVQSHCNWYPEIINMVTLTARPMKKPIIVKAFLCLRNHEGGDFPSIISTYPFRTVSRLNIYSRYYMG